ncbi:5-oxoprolinase subunit PxpB [Photobacterium sp. SDRW27]|uniref:5-oxoprolinase subunit PxpB n=1 Tax=Photobacterium obscurum TaxID=2829490 RepID=UPI00224320C4|nr:5-oxoprolinase subunit PxpB [Photobacterium obscurum]MCW8331213.1 5-oxoprolinase subunit PxpB [Photobacterium obscurum]
MIRVEPVSETCLIVYLGEQIDTQLAPRIGHLSQYLKEHFSQSLVEVIPSYTSLFIQYHPCLMTYHTLHTAIMQYADAMQQSGSEPSSRVGKLITLPVFYHHEVGPDLPIVASQHGLSFNQVAEAHSKAIYTVCAIGFAPGFAFLASVDSLIATPRRAEPRLKIPAGSVGIANEQTAVYPADSPGGWQIIGNCPQSLFSPQQQPMTPFEVGDRVKFQPISRDEFLHQGGVIWPHWK